jgi:hypothetical protein
VGYRLGVDLGTTFTAAAVERDGRAEVVPLGDHTPQIPSVLFAREDGQLLVGEAAVRRGGVQPDRVAREFKRRLGDRVPLLLGGEEFTAEQLNMYLGLDRPGQAVDLLRRTEQEVREPAARAELAALRAVMLAVEGDWAAYDEAIASVEATGEPGAYATTVALYARAVRQFHLARGPEALALNEQALSMLPDEGNAWFRAGLVSWRCVMQTYFGCLSEAAASATAGYEQARSVGWRGEAGAWFDVARSRGRSPGASAVRRPTLQRGGDRAVRGQHLGAHRELLRGVVDGRGAAR